LKFDPSSVIKSVETTEEMMKRLWPCGAKAELEPVMIDITDMITGAVQPAQPYVISHWRFDFQDTKHRRILWECWD
jgi:hypothetical protein